MNFKRPNILMIMADQLRPDFIGCYGNTIVKTPRIDSLARNGTSFTNAYTTCPVCVPARASLLSGKYCATNGAYDNGGILPSDEPTHNEYLNIEGYDTVLIGKAHFIGPDQLHGFRKRPMTNVYPTTLCWMPDRDANSLNPTNLHPNPIAVDYLVDNVGERQWSMEIDYDEEVVMQARRYLSGKRNQPSGTAQKPIPAADNQPFFLQVSFNHPHEPFHVQKKHWDLYEDIDIPIPDYPSDMIKKLSNMDKTLIHLHGTNQIDVTETDNLKTLHRAYYAMVSYLDEKVGEVLDSLSQFGLADNTIVIFISDHGDMLGDRGMIQKRVLYEPSVRIPLIISFPENHPLYTSAAVCSDPVSITDVAPTMLDLAGVKEWLPMDGRSLMLQLSGKNDNERYVFCENYSEGVTTSCVMVRKDRWKYTRILGDDPQLFNIENDSVELNNLAGNPEYFDIERELSEIIDRHFDLEKIDREAAESYQKRKIIQKSQELPGAPSWNWFPPAEADKLFWRTEE